MPRLGPSLGKTKILPERIFSACRTFSTSLKKVSRSGRINSYQAKNENAALRLYPPVPINTRFCKQTTTLPLGGGIDGRSPILVREGMPVAYSVYHMQRRQDLYGSDAGSFRPERWEGPELTDIKWGYLPFNGGPRLCLGSKFFSSRTSPSGQTLICGGTRGLWSDACFIRHRENDSNLSQNRTASGRNLGRTGRRAAASHPYAFKCRWM